MGNDISINIFKFNASYKTISLNNKVCVGKVDLIENLMSEDQTNYVIDITIESLKMQENHFNCTGHIREQLKSKYGGDWCVILYTQNHGDSSVNYFDDCYICFKIGKFYFKIFKSSLGDEMIRLNDKGNYNKVEIIKNKMEEDQKNYAIEITRKSLNMHNDHFECTEYISKQFRSKYSGDWCVILNPHGYGDSFFSYYDDCNICFKMGEFCFKIFKSSLGDKMVRLDDKGDYNKVEIIANKMEEDQKNYAIEITRESLNMHKVNIECSKYIKEQFDRKYGGEWCVILIPRRYGASYYSYHLYYINFIMGEFDVSIVKTHD